MSMVAIRRRVGERVYLLKAGMEPMHISAYFSTEGIPPKTEITLNIEAPADVVIEREEKLTADRCLHSDNLRLPKKDK